MATSLAARVYRGNQPASVAPRGELPCASGTGPYVQYGGLGAYA